jgi:pimeloyl-ACP methyl ester carboxylesterase
MVQVDASIGAAEHSAREGWLQRDGLKLRFIEWGSHPATAIVMLHGLRSYAYTWEPVARPLLPTWRVIALDQRGRGSSDWDERREYHTEVYVRDLAALLDHLDIERLVLLGHSMGAANAIVYASGHPHRVAALVIEDMGPGASASSRGSERIKRELAETPSSFASWSEAAGFWRRMRLNISEAAHQSRLDHSLKQDDSGRVVWRHDADGIAHARIAATPEQLVDLWPHVEALSMPTLLIRGANSDFLSADTADEMCRRNPCIRRADVEGASHYVHDDNLSDFNSVLQRFLCESF